VNVREIFKSGLTVPEHEVRDLHYIGEALPVPSQITTSISIEADASTGSSPIPAREDHVHAVDVASLIQFINENPTEVDLTNYYTKAEIDTIIDNLVIGEIGDIYYTEAEIDAMLAVIVAEFANYYTKAEIDAGWYTAAEIDALLLGLYDADFFTYEKDFSYGTTVAPTSTTTLGRIDVFRAFRLTEVEVTLVLASTTDYVIKIWQQVGGIGGFSVVHTATILAGNLYENDVLGVPLDFAANDQYLVTIDTESSGDGEVLVVQLRGFYDE
jgi:hypothetical protein